MLANELLLVLGLVIAGAVSLPVAQGATDSAPALLDRDLSNDIHAPVLQARGGKDKPRLKPGRPTAPSNQWANPMLPGMVNKDDKKKDDLISKMDQGWSGSSKPAPRPGTTKPPKVPKGRGGKGKRDVDEEAEEAAEYAPILQARGGKDKPRLKPGRPTAPSNQWANPMLPGVVHKDNKKDDLVSKMDQGWSGSSKPAPRPGTTKPPKVPKGRGGKGKRDVDEEAEEAAEYDQ